MTAQVPAVEPDVKPTPTARRLITGEELYWMTNLGPNDLVKGEIVERMPTGHLHGDVEITLGFFLKSYLREHKLGKVFGGETGVYTSREPDTVRGVDLAYMSRERFAHVKSQSYLDVAPELIVEIMSPHDAWSEVQEKLAEYFAIAVTVVWVVDPKLKQVHSYRAVDDVQIFRMDDTLTCEALLPGFVMPLAELFTSE
ncbi:MAG: Uma2 family endonuclease [Caldilineaceae bacterium]